MHMAGPGRVYPKWRAAGSARLLGRLQRYTEPLELLVERRGTDAQLLFVDFSARRIVRFCTSSRLSVSAVLVPVSTASESDAGPVRSNSSASPAEAAGMTL